MASKWRRQQSKIRTSGPPRQVPREETLRVDSMSIASHILVSSGWHITHVFKRDALFAAQSVTLKPSCRFPFFLPPTLPPSLLFLSFQSVSA